MPTHYLHKLKKNSIAAVLAQWIRLRLPFCGPGFESRAHQLRYFQLKLALLREKDEKKSGLAY